MIPYVLLHEIRAAKKVGVADTEDDNLLHHYAIKASRIIDRECARVFYPKVETRIYDIPKTRKLKFDKDLLSVTTLTNGDDSEISSSEYFLLPYNESPKYALELEPASASIWQIDASGGRYQKGVIDVLGVWGCHDEYGDAWQAVDVVQDNGGLDASVEEVEFDDIDGIDEHGMTPRCGRGTLLKIDDEFIYVLATDTSSQMATVTRGFLGSTAATHAVGVDIEVYRPMEVIRQITLRMALWLWNQRTSNADVDRVAISPDGFTILPMGLPKDVAQLIYAAGLRRIEAG